MSIDQQAAGGQVIAPTTERGENWLERLARSIGITTRASTVFGEAVERDGVMVIPVARVRWAFGSGSGRGRSAAGSQVGEGSGGGGAVAVSPIGYIEVKEGYARFRRIYDVRTITRMLVIAGVVAMLILRTLRKFARG